MHAKSRVILEEKPVATTATARKTNCFGGGRRSGSRPVSRVLSWSSHSSGMHVAAHLKRPTRELVRAARRGARPRAPLFGLAPGGVYPATGVAAGAVRSYRTISPLPTRRSAAGGIFSVALSVGSRPPGVTWHPALRSPDFPPLQPGRRSGCPADSHHEFYYSGRRLWSASL